MTQERAGIGTLLRRYRRIFWRPPRAHGESDPERTVSFLELFYDLVYVVVIAAAAHHLADHLTLEGVYQFAVIFALVWVAWLNGTLFYELHGREDVRTRTFVFLQMIILAFLAVFTGDAAGETGTAFGITYALFLGVLLYLWFSVYRADVGDTFRTISLRYMGALGVVIAIVVISSFLEDDVRMIVWGVLAAVWAVSMVVSGTGRTEEQEAGLVATESMVERFGLFTIIVLGEVVVGVVDGLEHSELDLVSIATGALALIIGFGLWWIYFDFTGRRLPRGDTFTIIRWMTAHLPVTMGIAAAGAAMVALIEHAHDDHSPAETAWVLSGSVAVALVGLAIISQLLVDYDRLRVVYGPTIYAMIAGAALAIGLAFLAPAPWLLAAGYVVILSAIWFVAVFNWLGTDEAIEVERSRLEPPS